MDMEKKLIQINTVCNGSTGNIMRRIQLAAQSRGYRTLSFYGRRKGFSDLPCEKFGGFINFWAHVVWNTITDRQGLLSFFSTRKMVRRLREEKPDIIHLHNLHGYYLNYPLLFDFLKKEYKGKLVWTFHDCWPVTGHCPYFVIKRCEKWKTGCSKCPNKGNYPISWFMDSSSYNYDLKKAVFSHLENLTIICPSEWMREVVKESFLKETRTVVISNGIDLDLFYPRKEGEGIEKYSLPKNKKILLGVASIWEERKGLGVFLRLAEKLPEDYFIVLVGLNKHQMKLMHHNMIGIERTENQEELAGLYSQADIFINPSQEESFSLVTVEAMACGTPVIALDSSAVKELVNEENGILLHEPELRDYLDAIRRCEKRKFDPCMVRKSVEKFSTANMTDRILKLYEEVGDEIAFTPVAYE